MAHDLSRRPLLARSMTALGALAAAALCVAVVCGCGGEPQRRATTELPAAKAPPADAAARPTANPPPDVAARPGANPPPDIAARPGVKPPPGVAARPGAHRAPHEAVPILMYHVIGTPRPDTPLPALWVKPPELAAEVRALQRAGYHGVTLQEVWNAWHHGATLPHKPVVFSFDDGYAGQVRDGLPTLRRAGWPGVLNLELHNLADMGGTRAVKRMIDAGWEVDSHTLTHPDLTTLGAAQLRHELAGSRARIRRLLGVPANFFCYPSGRYDPTVIAAVRRAGYLAATTTEPGFARPAQPYALARVRVDGGMGAAALLQRLRDLRGAAAG